MLMVLPVWYGQLYTLTVFVPGEIRSGGSGNPIHVLLSGSQDAIAEMEASDDDAASTNTLFPQLQVLDSCVHIHVCMFLCTHV